MDHEIPRYELRYVVSRVAPDGEYRVIDKAHGAAIGWMKTKDEALEYLGDAPFEDNT